MSGNTLAVVWPIAVSEDGASGSLSGLGSKRRREDGNMHAQTPAETVQESVAVYP